MVVRTPRKRSVRKQARASNAKGLLGDGGSAGAVLKLKLEHVIVLQALEDANRSHGRAVCVSEVVEEISARDVKRLERTYSNRLGTILAKILELLMARKLVFSPGVSNRRRFYGSVDVLDPAGAHLPDIRSRRYRVQGLVRETVEFLGRAVRHADLLDYAASNKPGFDLRGMSYALSSLVRTGEITIVGRTRGEGEGFNLYLPSDMDPEAYQPTRPLTWLDEVARTVEALWAERVEEVKVKSGRPKPLTTRDIRARVINSTFYTQREMKKNPQILVDAVSALSSSRQPLLRRIKRRGQKTLLWVPVGVANEDVDFGDFYANDAERVAAAVERAVQRVGRPVTVRDLRDEIEADFALQLVNSSSLAAALEYTAKENFSVYNSRGRQKRVTRRVCRIGRAGPNTYYHTNDAPEAHSFVRFRRIEIQCAEARLEEELEGIKAASLSCVAKGRAVLLSQEIETLRRDIIELLTVAEIDGATRREAEDLKGYTERAAEATLSWLVQCGRVDQSLPGDVTTTVPFWTAAEFLEVIKPLYPMAESVTSTNQFIRLMGDRVRRVPNPEFENRFSEDPRKAAELFFDRTDALLYMANQWGGPECNLQSMLAGQELGRLRDPRFVFPALADKSFETRLAAVACLAFLPSDEGNSRLRSMAKDDPDSGLRSFPKGSVRRN